MLQALSYWTGACEHKVKRVGEKAAELGSVHSSSGWSLVDGMPESLRADIEHINVMLPIRMDLAKEIRKEISAGARTARGI